MLVVSSLNTVLLKHALHQARFAESRQKLSTLVRDEIIVYTRSSKSLKFLSIKNLTSSLSHYNPPHTHNLPDLVPSPLADRI